MAGPSSHGGWRRHMRIARNAAHDAYGATPGVLSWQDVPVLGDGMKLKAAGPRFEPDTSHGGDYRRHVAVHHRQVVGGDIRTLLWPELSQYLLDMALLRVASAGANYQNLYGHVIDHFTPSDPRRCFGVVVGSMRLTVAGAGAQDARLTLSCIAQREEENNGLAENDFDYASLSLTPFMAGFARIEVDSAVVADVEQWTLSVENNIGEAPFAWSDSVDAAVRAHAIAGKRRVSLELTDLNNDDRFNEAIRDGSHISFSALFSHPGGHVMQIILPRLFVPESIEAAAPGAQATERSRLEAMAATGGPYEGEDIVYGVDLAAGGTTTLAPPM